MIDPGNIAMLIGDEWRREGERRAEIARYRRRQCPRLRRENGVWICVRAHTGVGAGVTPYAAYRDWCEKLARYNDADYIEDHFRDDTRSPYDHD